MHAGSALAHVAGRRTGSVRGGVISGLGLEAVRPRLLHGAKRRTAAVRGA